MKDWVCELGALCLGEIHGVCVVWMSVSHSGKNKQTQQWLKNG